MAFQVFEIEITADRTVVGFPQPMDGRVRAILKCLFTPNVSQGNNMTMRLATFLETRRDRHSRALKLRGPPVFANG